MSAEPSKEVASDLFTALLEAEWELPTDHHITSADKQGDRYIFTITGPDGSYTVEGY